MYLSRFLLKKTALTRSNSTSMLMRHKERRQRYICIALRETKLTWQKLKILLIRMDMSVTQLAEQIGCARPSIYLAFSRNNRPGVLKKLQEFYDKHSPKFPEP